MAWEVTLIDEQKPRSDEFAEVVNRINIIDPSLSTEPRNFPEFAIPCIDPAFRPDVSISYIRPFDSTFLDIDNKRIWRENFPNQFPSNNPNTLVDGFGAVISEYEYPVDVIYPTISLKSINDKYKYTCRFELEAVAVLLTYDLDAFALSNYILDGSRIDDKTISLRAGDVKAEYSSDKSGKSAGKTVLYENEQLAVVHWPHVFVKDFNNVPDDVMTISFGGEHGVYYTRVDEDYMFDTHVVAQLQWKVQAWNREIGTSMNSGPGFLKGRIVNPPMPYYVDGDKIADTSLGPYLQSVTAHVDRARCFGLWSALEGTSLHVSAYWELDSYFREEILDMLGSISFERTLYVSYKGNLEEIIVTPATKWSDESSYEPLHTIQVSASIDDGDFDDGNQA